MIDDPILPFRLPFIHQHGHQGRGKGLGGGADLKDRLRRYRITAALLLDPKPFCEDDRIVLHDGHGHARDVPRRHLPAGVGLKITQHLLYLPGIRDCSFLLRKTCCGPY